MTFSGTILGCGASSGVPKSGEPGGYWGRCNPQNPKNRRSRCSFSLCYTKDDATTSILIDTAPELRLQLIAHNITTIDAVLFTHDHADQCHGIDDLRTFFQKTKRPIPAFMDQATASTLTQRFAYCFHEDPQHHYPPILKHHTLPDAFSRFYVAGAGGKVLVESFDQLHGPIHSLGYKIGPFAYSSDVVNLSKESLNFIQGIDTWIVDCLSYRPHTTHAHLDRVLEWCRYVKPRRCILTNLSESMDYDELSSKIPHGVLVAYDGMSL